MAEEIVKIVVRKSKVCFPLIYMYLRIGYLVRTSWFKALYYGRHFPSTKRINLKANVVFVMFNINLLVFLHEVQHLTDC